LIPGGVNPQKISIVQFKNVGDSNILLSSKAICTEGDQTFNERNQIQP
jgi:hypothetical protein